MESINKYLNKTGSKASMIVMSLLSDAQHLNGTIGADDRMNFAKFIINKFENNMTVRVDAGLLELDYRTLFGKR